VFDRGRITINHNGFRYRLEKPELGQPAKTTLRVISLRSDQSNDYRFENALKVLGHKVTVLTSTEPAFALVNTTWPDVVIFDPISSFGMSGSVQRMRSGFDGPIVAVGAIPDATINEMLSHLGIEHFASNVDEFVEAFKQFKTRDVSDVSRDEHVINFRGFQTELTPTPFAANTGANNILGLANTTQTATATKPSPPERVEKAPVFKAPPASTVAPPVKKNVFDNGLVRIGITTVVAVAVTIAALVPILRNMPESTGEQEEVARALPIVPNILVEPLNPLSIEELSGEHLPLEIAGIADQAVVEHPAIAFWGDTAPDAFVTVNGEPVQVSDYGAFVVDMPLVDGANFIEVLASDFQGRTTRKEFTVVRLQ
jgi:hypothetical protein